MLYCSKCKLLMGISAKTIARKAFQRVSLYGRAISFGTSVLRIAQTLLTVAIWMQVLSEQALKQVAKVKQAKDGLVYFIV